MFFQLFLVSATATVVSSQLTTANCSGYLRLPEYTDIDVECGTRFIGLAIQICPAVYTGYNESLLFLNNIVNDPNCRGTLDTSIAPPVLRFTFPIALKTACGSTFKTTVAPGTGIFSDFSNIQTVNISGMVRSYDPTIGTVTYNAELKYFYSCAYPLEYLINNTKMDVSSTSIALKDGNGSFISMLKLQLFSDRNFTIPLTIPYFGIELRTKVFVQVHATNLTNQYFVLLDRCYASTSPLSNPSATLYNLFVPCYTDGMIVIIENGQSNYARFSFSAFRFTAQQNQTISTYYLHCITRLCERTICGTYRLCINGRRRRDVDSASSQDGVSESTTLTSPRIVTRIQSTLPSNEQDTSVSETSSTSSGLRVLVGVLVCFCIIIIGIAVVYTRRLICSLAYKMFFG